MPAASPTTVWLIDPVLEDGVLGRVQTLGEPAGVLQLVDRHGRDCARIAEELGVPHLEVPDVGPDGSPFEEGASLEWVALDEALRRCDAGTIVDLKTELALRRLQSRIR